jgi:hypothetical protein
VSIAGASLEIDAIDVAEVAPRSHFQRAGAVRLRCQGQVTTLTAYDAGRGAERSGPPR